MPGSGVLRPPGPICFDTMNLNEMMVDIDVTQEGVGEETKRGSRDQPEVITWTYT